LWEGLPEKKNLFLPGKGVSLGMCVTVSIHTLGEVKGRGAFLLAERKAHSAPTFDQEIPVKDFGERIMKASNCLSRLSKGKITRWREDEAGSVSIKMGKLMIVCVLAVFLISLSHFVKAIVAYSRHFASAQLSNPTKRRSEVNPTRVTV
jgi:hypothetical protein